MPLWWILIGPTLTYILGYMIGTKAGAKAGENRTILAIAWFVKKNNGLPKEAKESLINLVELVEEKINAKT